MKNNGNVVNVNKLMHENSTIRISSEAIKELSGRIKDKLYDLTPILEEIAQKHGRKTIYENDVIEALSYLDLDVI